MPWWVASLIANVCITYVEYVNTHASGGWLTVLPLTAVPIVIIQGCLFLSFSGAPHWLTAWAAFSLGSSAMRLTAVALTPDQHIGSWLWILCGVTTMLLGSVAVKEGLR